MSITRGAIAIDFMCVGLFADGKHNLHAAAATHGSKAGYILITFPSLTALIFGGSIIYLLARRM